MPSVDDIRDGMAGMSSPQRAAAATWMAGAWDEYAYRLSCAMAAVGPPPGIVGARDVLQALHSAGRIEEHPADAARQRFAHARRVMETIKHGVDSASAALALAEGQLATAIPPSSSSALVAVNLGPWSPTQDQRVGDVPVDALIASRPTSRHGCVRLHPSHPSQDASHNEIAPLGFVEHHPTVSDIQDHVTIDECSLVRPAHIRMDSTAQYHAHHSPGPPSPALSAASDKGRHPPSASQDGRPYDAEGLAHDEHVTSRNNAQTHLSNGTSVCGAYDTSACAPPDLNPEVNRLAQQQELRQQVWEAKKRALEAEAARVREARSGSVRSSEGTSAEVDAVLPPSLTRRSTSSARRHSSPAPARRLVDRIEAPRLVDRIAPRRASLVDRIEPLPPVEPPSQSPSPETQSTSLIDRIERTPCASPWRSPTPSLDESCSPSVDESCSPSIDESEDPATDDLEDTAADGLEDFAVDQFNKNRNLTSTVRSPRPPVLSPAPRASSSAVYDSFGAAYDSFGAAYDSFGAAYDSLGAVYDGSSSWSEVDTIIHEAVNKSPSTGAHRTPDHVHRTSDRTPDHVHRRLDPVHHALDDAHRTHYNADYRTRYNADQAGWTPASPATSLDSAITRGVEEMVEDEEEMQVDNEETDSEMVIDGRDGDDSQIDDEEGVRADDGYDGEMPMELSEDEGEGDDGTQRGCGTQRGHGPQSGRDASAAPEEPPTTSTEPGSPALATLPFFEDVPIDALSPPSSPAPSLVENRAQSPYASRVQGLLESTSKPALRLSPSPNGTSAGNICPPSPRVVHLNPFTGLDGHTNKKRIPLPPPFRFGTPYYSKDLNAEAPATLEYPELPTRSGYLPSSSSAPSAPASSLIKPAPSSATRPRLASAKTKAPAHSKLYKKARRSFANSMLAMARDIRSSTSRSPAAISNALPLAPNLTVGAKLVAASDPSPGQIVTFAQLGAGYRLTGEVPEAVECSSDSDGQEESDGDLDSLFDEIPEDDFDDKSSHASGRSPARASSKSASFNKQSADDSGPVEQDREGGNVAGKGEGVSGGGRVVDSDSEYTVEDEVVAVRTRLGEGEITLRRRVRKASGDCGAARPSKRIKLTY